MVFKIKNIIAFNVSTCCIYIYIYIYMYRLRHNQCSMPAPRKHSLSLTFKHSGGKFPV